MTDRKLRMRSKKYAIGRFQHEVLMLSSILRLPKYSMYQTNGSARPPTNASASARAVSTPASDASNAWQIGLPGPSHQHSERFHVVASEPTQLRSSASSSFPSHWSSRAWSGSPSSSPQTYGQTSLEDEGSDEMRSGEEAEEADGGGNSQETVKAGTTTKSLAQDLSLPSYR